MKPSVALKSEEAWPLEPRQASQPVQTANENRLTNLSQLGSVDIETPLVDNLSGALHALFDPIKDDVLPIYFGPLLGRLYLAGL